MTTIELSKTAEILLKRIVESRLGAKSLMMYDSMIEQMILCDCMIEHLIWEEARRLRVTDEDIKEEKK